MRFMTQKDPRREMYPHTLSGEPLTMDRSSTTAALHLEEISTDDIITAFGHMVSLRKFTWVERGYHDSHPIAILMALSRCRNLEEVELGIILFSVHDTTTLPDFDTSSPEIAGAKVSQPNKSDDDPSCSDSVLKRLQSVSEIYKDSSYLKAEIGLTPHSRHVVRSVFNPRISKISL